MSNSRRGLFLGFAGLAAVAWGWQRFGVVRRSPEYTDIPGLPGWRMAEFGGITVTGANATNGVFLGIGGDTFIPFPAKGMEAALYDSAMTGLPVAVFTDFFCPNCRLLEARLRSRADLAITWQELPLLGSNSELVARAMLAAQQQNGRDVFQRALLGETFRPSESFLARVATTAGINGDRMVLDMRSTETEQALEKSNAIAKTLGIWGTPAMTVGQTLVLGALSRAEIDAFIEVAS